MNRHGVLLIGGAPQIGKSAVARAIAARYEWGCVSSDDLAWAIAAVTNEQSHPAFHLLEQRDHRRYFITRSEARLASDAEFCNQAYWPAVKRVVQGHVDRFESAIIEGNAIWPNKVATLEMGGVDAVWLLGDEAVFHERVAKQAAFFESTAMGDELMRKVIGRSVMMNKKLEREVENKQVSFVRVEQGMTVEAVVDACLNVLGWD